MCDDIWIWNYNTNFRAYDLPFPNLRVIGPNIRYFLSNGVKGLFMQANGSGPAGEVSDLRNYLISRLIWNPSLDDRAVLEEFVHLHYRSAAPAIMDYLGMLHDNAERMGCHPGCFPKPEEVGLTPEIARRAFQYFERAEAAADDEAVRARVEKASICAYRAMIAAGNLEPGERGALIEEYIERAQRHGMSHTAEGTQASVFFEELREA